MHTATLRIACKDANAASAAAASLRPDDAEMVILRVDGTDLHVEASSATPMGLLRTLDDVVACLRATDLIDDPE